MANTIKPRGAWPYGQVVRANVYLSGGAVYPGDFVSTSSDGTVVAAASTTALLGVALGYASASGKSLLISDHPDQLYGIQSSTSSPSAATDFNLNYDIVATGGSTAYKMSRMALKGDSSGTTATLPLKALFISPTPLNAASAESDVVVAINNHQLKGGTGTLGT